MASGRGPVSWRGGCGGGLRWVARWQRVGAAARRRPRRRLARPSHRGSGMQQRAWEGQAAHPVGDVRQRPRRRPVVVLGGSAAQHGRHALLGHLADAERGVGGAAMYPVRPASLVYGPGTRKKPSSAGQSTQERGEWFGDKEIGRQRTDPKRIRWLSISLPFHCIH